MTLFEARRLEGDTQVECSRWRVRVPVGSVDGVGRELFHGGRDAFGVGVREGTDRCRGDDRGFIFPIRSMPAPIQLLTYAVPARYFLVIVRGINLKGARL